MSSLRSTFQTTVALFGLIAVLLGALEHEDLLFQGNLATGLAKETPAACDSRGAQWKTSPADSGTESEFRQEIDRDRIVSERALGVTFIARIVAHHPRHIPTCVAVRRISSRVPATGIVALRL